MTYFYTKETRSFTRRARFILPSRKIETVRAPMAASFLDLESAHGCRWTSNRRRREFTEFTETTDDVIYNDLLDTSRALVKTARKILRRNEKARIVGNLVNIT